MCDRDITATNDENKNVPEEQTETTLISAIAAKYGVTSFNLGYSDMDKWIAIIAIEYAADYANRVVTNKCFDCPANHHAGANV